MRNKNSRRKENSYGQCTAAQNRWCGNDPSVWVKTAQCPTQHLVWRTSERRKNLQLSCKKATIKQGGKIPQKILFAVSGLQERLISSSHLKLCKTGTAECVQIYYRENPGRCQRFFATAPQGPGKRVIINYDGVSGGLGQPAISCAKGGSRTDFSHRWETGCSCYSGFTLWRTK